MEFSNELKDVLKAHSTLKKVHINKDGEWLFNDTSSVPKSFGKFETFTKEDILGEAKTEKVKTEKVK